MIKKIHQTHAADALLPSEIKKEVESRMETMAKNNNMTIAQFRGFLGPHYYSFYRRQESMVAFQRFLMVKSGPRAMRNIVSTAIAKARKKWKALQGADQYRISEIIIYNRGEAGFSRDKIAELAALLSSGEAFSELASRSSESRTSQNNGDCGWHILDYFDRPIQDFLKNASIGDISPIIPLPTPRNPEKWALILVTDRRSPLKNGALSEAEKDPGDEVFRNNLFAAELERLSKAEMEDLEKSFPCTLNIGKKMTMPSS
jgi:parvulin-like peptidyl-prolyl isomerase